MPHSGLNTAGSSRSGSACLTAVAMTMQNAGVAGSSWLKLAPPVEIPIATVLHRQRGTHQNNYASATSTSFANALRLAMESLITYSSS